jgi:hypothetical protein
MVVQYFPPSSMSWLISSTIGDPVVVTMFIITVIAGVVAFIADKKYEPDSEYRRRMRRHHHS